MRISIFGMGYVGCVTGACFAEMGHSVIGVEPSDVKVEIINSGRTPIIENGLDALLAKTVKQQLFRATSDWQSALADTEIALVCVGTPSRSNGSMDLRYIERVCEQIGAALAVRPDWLTVVIRSTVAPGTLDKLVIPVLEKTSGKKVGRDFGLCMHPEFLREGTSIHDFYHPPKTVIGEYDARSGDALASLYTEIPGEIIRTSYRAAEMVKYADNCFHALKVAFANEIGNVCQGVGVDSHTVMEIFCKDTKLNLSPYYLKPGFAFGGSCLPKDLRALIHEARMLEIEVPLLVNILESNSRQILKVTNKLLRYKGKRLGFLGLSFKGGTDDLRSSPIVQVIETLLGKGFEIQIFDPHVSLARLMGANKEYIEKEIPHISKLMCSSADELIDACEILIVSHATDEFRKALTRANQDHVLIDLVRIGAAAKWPGKEYYGICW